MTATFHAPEGPALVCDGCGCLVERTERSRAAHGQVCPADQVIDLRDRVRDLVEELAG